MYLYLHEFEKRKDANIKEIRNMLFDNSLKDYLTRTDTSLKNQKVETTKHGKPFFSNADHIHFSISHSGKYWACMFDIENVGLDIEEYSRRNMPVSRFTDITNRFFKPDERSYVLEGSTDEDMEDDADEALKNRFFKIWTAKESYMKYTGNGFTEGFKNFSVLDNSLSLNFGSAPIDPHAVLTYCSQRETAIEEMINL